MYKNLFYYKHVNVIGGVETFFYEIAKKYGKDHDITLLYQTGDPKQLQRLRELIRVVQYAGGIVQCERAFFGYAQDIIDQIEAEEYIQVVHADFKDPYLSKNGYMPKVNQKFSRYICVSENNAASFEELTGQACELSYNPITLAKPRKILHLISATRLTPEKGLSRMEKLAEALDAAGVQYIWTVYTNSKVVIRSPNVIIRPTRLDMTDFIADADYLVQLSDTEGYSYSILEALCLGTPVIVTPLPVLPELQVKDGVNGFVLPYEMDEIPVDRIVKGLKKFKYTPQPDRWAELLLPGAGDYHYDPDRNVTVRSRILYRDLHLQRLVKEDEVLQMPYWRALELEAKRWVSMIGD